MWWWTSGKRHALSLWIHHVDRVIDPGVKLRREIYEFAAFCPEEAHGIAQLGIAADLEAEAHAVAVFAEIELVLQSEWVDPQAMMLAARAKEHTTHSPVPSSRRDGHCHE